MFRDADDVALAYREPNVGDGQVGAVTRHESVHPITVVTAVSLVVGCHPKVGMDVCEIGALLQEQGGRVSRRRSG